MDDIADQLAAEEHLQGKPVGERGHCSYCDDAADKIEAGIRQARLNRRRAECPHDDYVELRVLGELDPVSRICKSCGHAWALDETPPSTR